MATTKKTWRCMRGHENEADLRPCQVCRLPRWITRRNLAIAATTLGVLVVFGGYSLSQSLKRSHYQSLVKQLAQDGEITAADRKELESSAVYLRLSKDEASRLEAAITGKAPSTAAPTAEAPRPAAVDLQAVRKDLEAGRLAQAREAVSALHAKHPERADVTALKREIDEPIKSRIEVKLLGRASGEHVLNADDALVGLTGNEAGFRLYVEPHETLYLYVIRVNAADGPVLLFPKPGTTQEAANPLPPDHAIWLPSEDPAQTFSLPIAPSGDVLYLVSTRWPARDLEGWSAGLSGPSSGEAARKLLLALNERRSVAGGGLDVRTLRFSKEAGGSRM